VLASRGKVSHQLVTLHSWVVSNFLSLKFCLQQVYSIREAAANNLKRLAEEFGPEWALQHIIPQVLA